MEHDKTSVEVFFYPETVALIGASGKPGAFSHEMLRNLSRGFQGRVYAVNPKYKEILGIPSYPSILDIPDQVDLAVIAVRAERVPQALLEAGEKKVKGAIIVAGGFAETGEKGAKLQVQVAEIARKYGVRVVGPNCIGVYNAVNGLDTFFLPPEKMRRPPKGYIAVVSQSGAFLTTMMDWLATENVGIVKAINIGNKVDVDEAEIIEYYSQQEYVKTIMVYIEGVFPNRGRPLIHAIRKARENKKTIVILKGGKTSYGARAAKSHTAALAGDYTVFSSLIREAGAIEASTPTEFVDWAKALSLMGHLKAEEGKVLVITNAGGPGVLGTDELSRRGLKAPPTPREIVEKLSKQFPPIVALGNPIDLTGQATDDDYKKILEELAARREYDSLLIIAPVQPATMTIRVADIIADITWKVKKPTTVMTIGAEYGAKVADYLESRGIPTYPLPDRAASSLWALVEASKPVCPYGVRGKPPRKAVEIIRKALSLGLWKLPEDLSLELLKIYNIPIAKYCIATTIEEAIECRNKLSEPLVAKIISPDISHKSDIGGVLMNITTNKIEESFKKLLTRVKNTLPHARISGVLFQEQAPRGLEIIIGAKRDPSFGPIVLTGLGGVMVELIKDVSIGLAPTSKCQASRMLESLKSSKMLEGYRGIKPRDKNAIIDVILKVSRIISEISEIAEIDINPLISFEKGAIAVDARIILQH